MTTPSGTPEERAEKIFDDVWLKRCGDKPSAIVSIAAALKDYGNERFSDAIEASVGRVTVYLENAGMRTKALVDDLRSLRSGK
jgi:hypothetical protein